MRSAVSLGMTAGPAPVSTARQRTAYLLLGMPLVSAARRARLGERITTMNMKYRIDRRKALGLMGGAASLVAVPGARVSAQTLDKVSYQTNWRAQAEHGGFYLARHQRHLQEIRHRVRRPPGRAAAEPLAAPARRARRHDHVELVRGHQLRQGEPAVPGDRRDLPEGPAGHHLASGRRPRQVRGPQGQADPDRRRRAHQLLAVPEGASSASPTSRRGPTPSTWRRSSPTSRSRSRASCRPSPT